MSAYRIVVADDHALFRQGLRRTLEESPDLEVVAEAADGIELLNILSEKSADMIILDVSMPNLNGLEVIGEIKKRHPHLKILVLTMHDDKQYLYRSLSSGADGYFLKKDADTELFGAIDRIQGGKIFVSAQLASGDLTEDWEMVQEGFKPALTARELEVLKLIAEGKSNRDAANTLFISVHTVERHRANIMNKLKLRKTADLVKYAIQNGYL